MIDYLALSIGHGLLAIALLRLVMRDSLDTDPLIHDLKAETTRNRQAASGSGRSTARRMRPEEADDHDPETPTAGSKAAALGRTRANRR
ncbi:MAG: hypothetical protein EAY70_03140 [Sphingomonadales bacterium]|nr:MAG: hypothetical protein EAY70_03140 [Sphingomonadales bacterium]